MAIRWRGQQQSTGYGVVIDRRFGVSAQPDRVFVRVEGGNPYLFFSWGMEHAGVRKEIVQPAPGPHDEGSMDPARACRSIERDLRRAVGLDPPPSDL
jgi:hypothetical protein